MVQRARPSSPHSGAYLKYGQGSLVRRPVRLISIRAAAEAKMASSDVTALDNFNVACATFFAVSAVSTLARYGFRHPQMRSSGRTQG